MQNRGIRDGSCGSCLSVSAHLDLPFLGHCYPANTPTPSHNHSRVHDEFTFEQNSSNASTSGHAADDQARSLFGPSPSCSKFSETCDQIWGNLANREKIPTSLHCSRQLRAAVSVQRASLLLRPFLPTPVACSGFVVVVVRVGSLVFCVPIVDCLADFCARNQRAKLRTLQICPVLPLSPPLVFSECVFVVAVPLAHHVHATSAEFEAEPARLHD